MIQLEASESVVGRRQVPESGGQWQAADSSQNSLCLSCGFKAEGAQ